MAFLDFMNQGMSGTQPVNQNTMVAGNAGASVGPTWGDVSKAAMQYGSKPGSSAPAFTGLMPSTAAQPQQMEPLAPTAPKANKTSMGQDTGGDNNVLDMIIKFFSSMVLGGA
jgi:hypothetical protein